MINPFLLIFFLAFFSVSSASAHNSSSKVELEKRIQKLDDRVTFLEYKIRTQEEIAAAKEAARLQEVGSEKNKDKKKKKEKKKKKKKQTSASEEAIWDFGNDS